MAALDSSKRWKFFPLMTKVSIMQTMAAGKVTSDASASRQSMANSAAMLSASENGAV